jgi:hypothetical protein
MNKSLVIAMAIGALFLGIPANAQPTSAITMVGSAGPFVREARAIAIPAYHVTYITQKQGTAVATLTARNRLNLVLTGIDEALMRQLTNEAHADLVAQLSAAGLTVLPSDAARAIASGIATVPGNADVQEVKPGITIGRGLKNGFAAYGATEAPMLAPFHNPGVLDGPSGMATMNLIGPSGKIGRAAYEAGAAALVPNLIIDFADLDVRASSRATSVGGQTRFAIRTGTGVSSIGGQARGPGYLQSLTMTRDVAWGRSFAVVDQGGAAVRQGSMTATPDRNFIMRDRARGDAVQADPVVWAELMREAYRTYNAAITAQIVRARR